MIVKYKGDSMFMSSIDNTHVTNWHKDKSNAMRFESQEQAREMFIFNENSMRFIEVDE